MLGEALQQLQSDCLCKPGAVKWIEVWFSDCVYTRWEILGFCVGFSSMFFWMVAQLPQFVSNFLRQSADALSPWFLFQWLAGDSLNLLGCLLTGDQLATETATAVYFLFADALIISQYLYYQFRSRDNFFDESVHKPINGYRTVLQIDPASALAANSPHRKGKQKQEYKRQLVSSTHPSNEFGILARGERFQDFEEEKLHPLKNQVAIDPRGRKSLPPSHLRRQLRRVVAEYGLDYGPPSLSKISTQQAKRLSRIDVKLATTVKSSGLKNSVCLAATIVAGIPGTHAASETRRLRKLLMICSSSSSSSEINHGRISWVKQTGVCFGWISSVLYLGSRISQLIKNNQRKSAEGLSLAMVSCAVLANLTYGSAILMRAKSWNDLIGKAPWLVGSLGTVSLDITIFLQAQYLSCRKAEEPNERTPLLPA